MRPPASILVLDANIVVPVVTGRSRSAFLRVATNARLVTTRRVTEEVDGRLRHGFGRPDMADRARQLLRALLIVDTEVEAGLTERAAAVLRDAPASGNGSTADAHILAAAWLFDADVWTHDRDFAGTGVASWSTANLLAALD